MIINARLSIVIRPSQVLDVDTLWTTTHTRKPVGITPGRPQEPPPHGGDACPGDVARCSSLWRQKEEHWRARRAARQQHVRGLMSRAPAGGALRVEEAFDAYEPEW